MYFFNDGSFHAVTRLRAPTRPPPSFAPSGTSQVSPGLGPACLRADVPSPCTAFGPLPFFVLAAPTSHTRFKSPIDVSFISMTVFFGSTIPKCILLKREISLRDGRYSSLFLKF